MDIKRINGKYNTVFRGESAVGINVLVEHFHCMVTIAIAPEQANELEEKLKELGLEVGK